MPDNPFQVFDYSARQVRVWHNRIWSFLTKHFLNLLTVGLLLASLFYFLAIQPVRNRALSSNPELFTDGETVTVTRVIDGDELRIENDKGSTRMRLLGIKSFDASANDFLVSEIGKMCVDYLENNFVGQRARLRISPKGVDGEGRLLGSLFVGEAQDRDLARELIDQGMTLVYLRYDFADLEDYQSVQQQARTEGRGLWLNERVTTRAESLLSMWQRERKAEEEGRD